MLLIDGKEFNPSNPNSFKEGQKNHPFLNVWNQADKAMKEVADRNKGKIKLVLSQRHITKDKFIDDRLQRPHKSNGVMAKTSEVYVGDDQSFEVTYYENSQPAKAGGERKYTPRKIDIPGDITLNYNKEKTKAFFLLFVSRHIGTSDDPNIAALQNQDRIRRPHFELDDRYTKYQAMADTDKKVADVMGSIYSMTEDKLHDMVDAYRVPVSDKKHASMAELQQALKNYVLKKTDGKYDLALMDEFIEFAEGGSKSEEATMKAIVNRAYKEGVLITRQGKTDNKTVTFVDMDTDGEKKELFFYTPGKKHDRAYKYFTENKDKYEELKKKLQ